MFYLSPFLSLILPETKTNKFIGHKCVRITPIYDERLLPVLYSSIGIPRRLGKSSHVLGGSTTRRISGVLFIFWCGESNISGHNQAVTYFVPGNRCLLPTPSSPLQSFETSSGMPVRHVSYDEPGQSTTISTKGLPIFVTTISFVIPLCLKWAKAWIRSIDNPHTTCLQPQGLFRDRSSFVYLYLLFIWAPVRGEAGDMGCQTEGGERKPGMSRLAACWSSCEQDDRVGHGEPWPGR